MNKSTQTKAQINFPDTSGFFLIPIALGTRDLLLTKYNPRLQSLHSLYTEVPDINNLGKLLSLSQ
jgi:hypothetical protein